MNIKDILKKIGYGLKKYLTDWKNLAVHAIVGIILVYVVFLSPLPVWVRLGIFCCVVIFNVIRMKYADKKKAKKEAEEDTTD